MRGSTGLEWMEKTVTDMTDEPLYEDVLLAYLKYAPPRPIPTTPIKFTVRQRIRIRRSRLNSRVQQWIHDHLTEAICDC
jgi:hypothetical protein